MYKSKGVLYVSATSIKDKILNAKYRRTIAICIAVAITFLIIVVTYITWLYLSKYKVSNDIETIPLVKFVKRFSIKLNYINSRKNYPIMELEKGMYRINIEEQVDDPYYVVGDIIVGNGMKYLDAKLTNSGVHGILAVIELNQNMLEMRFRFDFAQNPFFIPEEEIETLREFNFNISWIKF